MKLGRWLNWFRAHCIPWRPGFNAQHWHEKPGAVVHTCSSHAEEGRQENPKDSLTSSPAHLVHSYGKWSRWLLRNYTRGWPPHTYVTCTHSCAPSQTPIHTHVKLKQKSANRYQDTQKSNHVNQVGYKEVGIRWVSIHWMGLWDDVIPIIIHTHIFLPI